MHASVSLDTTPRQPSPTDAMRNSVAKGPLGASSSSPSAGVISVMRLIIISTVGSAAPVPWAATCVHPATRWSLMDEKLASVSPWSARAVTISPTRAPPSTVTSRLSTSMSKIASQRASDTMHPPLPSPLAAMPLGDRNRPTGRSVTPRSWHARTSFASSEVLAGVNRMEGFAAFMPE